MSTMGRIDGMAWTVVHGGEYFDGTKTKPLLEHDDAVEQLAELFRYWYFQGADDARDEWVMKHGAADDS